MAAKRSPYPGKPSGRGKGVLQQAALDAGMSRRQSALIVDAVIDAWKGALARHEEVELPVGKLRVVKKKKRRVFQFKPNLKGIKHRLYDVNRNPYTVQLVKKKLDGEPIAELVEPATSPLVPVAANDHISSSRLSMVGRSVHFAHLGQDDLAQRIRSGGLGASSPRRSPGTPRGGTRG